ncbi:hypothetical protein [Aeromicrobium sp. UC242_57]|uniref:hypothetical protein n=1 Tax=Aeromicrobium sp. UC242_57 TaxID=3374624 RepID=UPI0037A37130
MDLTAHHRAGHDLARHREQRCRTTDHDTEEDRHARIDARGHRSTSGGPCDSRQRQAQPTIQRNRPGHQTGGHTRCADRHRISVPERLQGPDPARSERRDDREHDRVAERLHQVHPAVLAQHLGDQRDEQRSADRRKDTGERPPVGRADHSVIGASRPREQPGLHGHDRRDDTGDDGRDDTWRRDDLAQRRRERRGERDQHLHEHDDSRDEQFVGVGRQRDDTGEHDRQQGGTES